MFCPLFLSFSLSLHDRQWQLMSVTEGAGDAAATSAAEGEKEDADSLKGWQLVRGVIYYCINCIRDCN